MTKKRGTNRPSRMASTGRFSLGAPAAETDPLLSESFYANPDFETIASQQDPSVFVVGRTGSGKSAVLEQLKRQHPEQVIFLNPENLALPYLTNLDVIRQLTDLDVHLEPFFRALWKHVILERVMHLG